VYVPRWIVLGMLIAVASVTGWLVRELTTDCAATPSAAAAAPAAQGQPVQLTVQVASPNGETATAGSVGRSTRTVRTTSGGTLYRAGSAQPTTRLVPYPVGFAQPIIIRDQPGRDIAPAAAGAGGSSVIANGDHIVIASDGSIVSVGDNTVVKGNTGNAGSSGAISVDVNDSTIETGGSTTDVRGSTSAVSAHSPTTSNRTSSDEATTEGASLRTFAAPTTTSPQPLSASAVGGGSPTSRAVGIAGWENKSLDVAGSDNVLTYDDSAAFVNRVGNVNANTGNADSSGVSTVDAVESRIRTGSSVLASAAPVSAPFDPEQILEWYRAGFLGPPGTTGVTIIDQNGMTTANADDTLVIGGDGIRDRSVRVRGDRNVTTSGDGTAAVGGVGDMNAQIGDSSTSGAVVMAVRASDIASGNSTHYLFDQSQIPIGDP
jgi:hypothetical protein